MCVCFTETNKIVGEVFVRESTQFVDFAPRIKMKVFLMASIFLNI